MTETKAKKSLNFNIEIGGIGRGDILFMTKHLAIALKNGLTIIDGLEMLFEQATSHKLQTVLRSIIEMIQTGHSYYDALSLYPQYFSPMYINMVKTGELSGTLKENLLHLAAELKKSEELRQKIKSAMMYPILILVAVFGLGFSVAIFVLPKIVPLFKTLGAELPASTRLLIFVSDLFEKHTLWIIGGTVGFFIFFFWLIRRKLIKPLFHLFILKVPIFGPILSNIQLEQFARTLGTLLRSGVTVDRSLKITADAGTNLVYKRAVLSLIPQVETGKTLSEAMSHYPKLFPKIALRMVGMGEKTGSLEETLNYLSEMYGEEVDNTVKNLSTILEPAMLIMIGCVVGFVAISILGPIYKITGAMQH